MSLNC
jgi:WD40 repeat protein